MSLLEDIQQLTDKLDRHAVHTMPAFENARRVYLERRLSVQSNSSNQSLGSSMHEEIDSSFCPDVSDIDHDGLQSDDCWSFEDDQKQEEQTLDEQDESLSCMMRPDDYMSSCITQGLVTQLYLLGFNCVDITEAIQSTRVQLEHIEFDSVNFADVAFDAFHTLITALIQSSDGSEANKQNLSISMNDSDETFEAENFPWPVFEMAAYEFGNEGNSIRSFDSVVVFAHLPKVRKDKVEELEGLLLHKLFLKLATPIDVVIPCDPVTGKGRGFAFIEFRSPKEAKTVALAVNGLMWAPFFLPIKACPFRKYSGGCSPAMDGENNDLLVDETAACMGGKDQNMDGLQFQRLDDENDSESFADEKHQRDDDDDDESLTEKATDSDGHGKSDHEVAANVNHGSNESTLQYQQLKRKLLILKRRFRRVSNENKTMHQHIKKIEKEGADLLFHNDQLEHCLEKYRQLERNQNAFMLTIAQLRRRIETEEEHRSHMTEVLKKCQEVTDHLRTRLHHVTGRHLESVDLKGLQELEVILEHGLKRIRQEKEEKLVQERTQMNLRKDQTKELKLCVVCQDKEKSVLLLPCRHLCICDNCANHHQMERCPMCRVLIDEKMSVYS